MRWYLAGPMSGIPSFNFPAFHEAAKALRSNGYDIISPAELDSEAIKAEAIKSLDGQLDAEGKIGGETWGDVLARDVRIISNDVHGIVFLPNWYKSRGAKLEAFVGLLNGHKFGRYDQRNSIIPVGPDSVLEAIYNDIESKF